MLDIKIIREEPEKIKKGIEARNVDPSIVDGILAADKKRREITVEAEKLRAELNKTSKKIGALKKEGGDASEIIEKMNSVKEKIKELNSRLSGAEEDLRKKLLYTPNIQHESVPVGKDESANVVVRKEGENPSFSFKPKPHWEIGGHLDILDNKRAAKISGARFTLYKGMGALLERALINFMLDVQTKEHGYTEVIPPFLVNAETMTGTGQLPKFEDDLFKTEGGEYYLIPTSEVPVVNIHRDEILNHKDLPVKYTSYTPCFRSEAGSYGKDVKGIIRMHQFNKVEMIRFVEPETSYEALEDMVKNAEVILKRLGLNYRVLLLCTGDAGDASAKTYDIEVWHAGAESFREASSVSNCTDYQARRAKIRYRDKDNKVKFAHTLNGSGLATSRLLPAILENFQTEDMEVIIPEVLRPYMGSIDKITKR